MYARVTTTVLSEGEFDGSADVFEQVLPAVRDLDGFRGMYVLSEVEGRKIVAVSLWETAADLENAEPVMDGLRDAETSFRQIEMQETARFRVSGAAMTIGAADGVSG